MQRIASLILAGLLTCGTIEIADATDHGSPVNPFQQLDDKWAPPSDYRTASGAPGHKYWQQRADHNIAVRLDEDDHRLTGSETITYTNNSPDFLNYLWVQLDQNRFRTDSKSSLSATTYEQDRISFRRARLELGRDFGGGQNITSVVDAEGQPLPYEIVGALMRIDLAAPLSPGQRISFSIAWDVILPNIDVANSRGGYELFEDNPHAIYTVAQWFPRMAAYTDRNGWVLEPFLGGAEFATEFGDYQVEITVPDDHIVAATGELQNETEILSAAQRERMSQARQSDRPIMIATPEEALNREEQVSGGERTWIFKAEDVRDFAFATSRRFIWDAMAVQQSDGSSVMAMSFYPNDANPLWEQYSTHAVAHALEVYSAFTFPYPYPVAQSVNGAVYGMEYPMIGFNGPRPEDEDGERTYSRTTKFDLLSVIFHETGHNYFPMIVNSNERLSTWMDEGLNTFLEYQSQLAWEPDYPADRGPPVALVDYMSQEDRQPIMSPPETIIELGNNAYASAGTALVILRETVLGPELFDFAFREYANRWKFKRPTPEDFFRTMEDASGVDLDWFWRGWFYETNPVDIGISGVTKFTLDDGDPDSQNTYARDEKQKDQAKRQIGEPQDRDYRVDRFPELKDFYNENDEFLTTDKDRNEYDDFLQELESWQRDVLKREEFFYRLDLENYGGMVMPVRLRMSYADDTKDEILLPAEIWRFNASSISRWIVSEKPILQFSIDPYFETTDINRNNNEFPREASVDKLEVYDDLEDETRNLMKDIKVERETPENGESAPGD